MGTPAKVLAPGDVRRLMTSVASRRHGLRDRALVTLSFKAGLRACEMAGLDWSMVLGPDGRIGNSLQIAGAIAKNGRGRRVPLHPELKSVLLKLHGRQDRPRRGPVIRSQQGDHMTPKSVVNLFRELTAASVLMVAPLTPADGRSSLGRRGQYRGPGAACGTSKSLPVIDPST